jgi:HK97 gp10 family phage protein
MLSSMDVKGLANLDKALAGLGAAAGGRALVAALKDAAEPVHAHMIANAAENEGDLKAGIKKRAKKGKGQGKTSAKVSVGTNKKHFHAAIAAEFGTVKQAPKPFIRLALEKNWQKSASIFSYALKKRIEQQARRLAKQSLK